MRPRTILAPHRLSKGNIKVHSLLMPGHTGAQHVSTLTCQEIGVLSRTSLGLRPGGMLAPREKHLHGSLASGTRAHGRRATSTLPLGSAPRVVPGVRAPWAHSAVCLMYALASRRSRGRRCSRLCVIDRRHDAGEGLASSRKDVA